MQPDSARSHAGLVTAVAVPSAVGALLTAAVVLSMAPVVGPAAVESPPPGPHVAIPAQTIPQLTSAWPGALVGALVTAGTGLVVGALLLALMARATQAAPGPPTGRVAATRSSSTPAPDTHRPAVSAADPRVRQLIDQRAALVRGVADMISLLPEELAWQATNVLKDAGVRILVPDGQRFDPGVHHAVGTQPSVDGQLPETIARTVRAGYADGERVLVPARVVVVVDPAPAGSSQ